MQVVVLRRVHKSVRSAKCSQWATSRRIGLRDCVRGGNGCLDFKIVMAVSLTK